jgi:RNA methyltransferase, TrmH family
MAPMTQATTRSAPPPRIESASNPRIKAALSLRDRREREATGRTLVDGARESRRALEAGAHVVTAFVAPDLLGGADADVAIELARTSGAEIVEVGPRAFERLAYGDRADGIVLVVETPPTDLASFLPHPGDAPLLVVTEAVEKPGNLGAILRSADGAGADGVIAIGGTDPFNPNVIRASAGTVFGVPIAVASRPDALGWLRDRRVRLVAARVDATQLHTDADLTGWLAIVLGSEAEGLTDAWRSADVESVRLPMLGLADSLNVSVAAAILLYEARRQRDTGPADNAPRTGDTPT